MTFKHFTETQRNQRRRRQAVLSGCRPQQMRPFHYRPPPALIISNHTDVDFSLQNDSKQSTATPTRKDPDTFGSRLPPGLRRLAISN
ncbi:uncharacterized [Tachysurus ichikawai]